MNLVLIATNLGAAFLLDRWEWSYRVLFPVAGVIGFGAHAIYARLRVRGNDAPPPAEPPPIRPLRSLGRAFATTVRILREDPRFRAYEAGFFIYGLAFLVNLPLVVILIVNELELDYDQASFGRFVVAQVMMVLLAPVAGRLLDRSHPARMMGVGCALLTIHGALLFLTTGFWTLFASYLVFGVAMTTVILAWNLGPVQFARTEREAADYMAVHVTLTGLRAVIAPGIALAAKGLLGLRAGFVVSTGFYALAALLMFRLDRRVGGGR
jgi:MFS family permease